MEEQQEIHDITTIMKKYNFHKPINISVIIEDQDNEPNRSEVLNYAGDSFIGTCFEKESQRVNSTIQEQNLYTRNQTIISSDIIPSQIYDGNANKRNFKYCQSPGNNAQTPFMETLQFYKPLLDPNSNIKEKTLLFHNSQRNETVLINRVAVILASIIEAYVLFCARISKSEDQQYISQIRAECSRVKLKLFHKCWEITNDFLLQHQNNNRFIENVLYKTEQCSKVKLPKKHMAHLYGDLLKWIKLKQCEMTKIYQNKRRNEIFSTHTIRTSKFVSNASVENRPGTKIFASGPPGSQVTITVDPNILEQQRIQEKRTDQPPYSNNLFVDEYNLQNKQSTISNAPSWSSSMYDSGSHLSQHTQNNICTRIPDITPVIPQDITRSSISRDSGFMSPVTSVSPSEYYIDNVQYPSSQYEPRTINFDMSNATSIDKNFVVHSPQFWN